MNTLTNRAIVMLCLVCLLRFTAAAHAAVPSFSCLTDTHGGSFTGARRVSADGSVVVGRTSTARGVEAFRWSAESRVIFLGQLSGGPPVSGAYGASADGSVVIGQAGAADGAQAFRWTERSGMVGLGDLAGGVFESGAHGVSADGSIVVGSSLSVSGSEAFRWAEHSGMVGLGDLPGGGFSSIAYSVSDDGSVVVGEGSSAQGSEAFRSTERSSMVGLGDLPGGSFDSTAHDVSADGSVVVGMSSSASGLEAFRWTEEEGMVSLGHLPGHTESIAMGVSADGSVVVGWSGNGLRPDEAFIWDSGHGMRCLQEVLTELGTDVFGWKLTRAVDVSADGKSIVGTAVRPDGKIGNWLANFAPQPETARIASVIQGPSALLLALSALAAIGIWWHRRLARVLRVCACRGTYLFERV